LNKSKVKLSNLELLGGLF